MKLSNEIKVMGVKGATLIIETKSTLGISPPYYSF